MNTFRFSEAGGHATNEDAQEVCVHPKNSECLICVVADGQGGRAGGREAARLAVAATVDAASSQQPSKLARASLWPMFLQEVDAVVNGDPNVGFTTLVALAIFPDTVVGASNGDSGALALVDRGHHILTDNQIKKPPVGTGMATFVPFACELRPPWKILTMSDGVWKYAGWESIVEIATSHSGMELVDAVANKARLPKSGRFQDDFTLVLVENGP